MVHLNDTSTRSKNASLKEAALRKLVEFYLCSIYLSRGDMRHRLVKALCLCCNSVCSVGMFYGSRVVIREYFSVVFVLVSRLFFFY